MVRRCSSSAWAANPLSAALATLLVCLVACWTSGAAAAETASPGVGSSPSRPPTRAKVVVVDDSAATVAFRPQLEILERMFARGLTNLTGQATVTQAWAVLLATNDVVGIKVHSSPGPISGTRPVVVEALARSLLSAGVATNRLLIWDKHLVHLRLGGFTDLGERFNIRVAAASESGWDTNHFYESPVVGTQIWGDQEFGRDGPAVGRRSYVSELVSREMTRIISVAPLLNHNLAGTSGHLLGLSFGSVDNALRFASDPANLAVAVPEIYALPILGDRVVLNITDALLAQYSGEQRMLLHYSGILNQVWFSRDPVALDVLAILELERQRRIDLAPPAKADLTLYRNATVVEIGVSDTNRIDLAWPR